MNNKNIKIVNKVMNIFAKTIGILQLILFITYCFNIFEPSKFNTAGNMLILGLIFILITLEYKNKPT